MKQSLLNFTHYRVDGGSEFPQCCLSGYYMSYNTHLRDPMRDLSSAPIEAPEVALVQGLAAEKKSRSR